MDPTARYQKYIFVRSIAWRLRLDAWEGEQLNQVLRSVDQAKSSVIRKLESKLRLPMYSKNEFEAARAKALLDELSDMTAGVKYQLGQDLDDIGTAAARNTVAEYNDIFSVGGTLPNFNNVQLSPEQLRAIVDTPLGGLQAQKVVDRVFDYNLIDRVKGDIDSGLLKGESYRAMVDRVQENWATTRLEATQIVRTQTMEMNNRCGKAVADQNRDIIQDKWEWSAILDNRACIRCAVLDGSTFDMDDDIDIPLHISCRCIRRIVPKSWAEITDGKMDIPEVERSMRNWVLRDGTVDTGNAVIDAFGKREGAFRDFFGDLSHARQVEIVGPTRAGLIRDGKIKFEDLADNKGRIFELRKDREGLASTKY